MLFKIPQLGWDLEPLKTEPMLGDNFYTLPAKLKQANFSIVLLRFWFIYHFLLAENSNHAFLHIAELSDDEGQLLDFINATVSKGYPDISFTEWDVLVSKNKGKENGEIKDREIDGEIESEIDRKIDRKKCSDKGSKKQTQSTAKLKQYDAIVVFALPEDAAFFEEQITELLKQINKNGILIGVCRQQSSQLKQKNTKAISANLVRKIATQKQLEVDFLSGGYFMRSRGLISVQRKLWFRFNLLLGALMPCWAAEVYWVLRK